MKKITWREIKKEVGDNFVVCEDLQDMSTGECTVDITAGKYAGYSVPARIIFAESKDDWDTIEIEDSAVVYNPAE